MVTEIPKRWPLLLLFGAIIGYQTLVPPIVGLADNGDYIRIGSLFRLDPVVQNPADRFFRYVPEEFYIDTGRAPYVEHRVTGHLFAGAAVAISKLVSKSGNVDMRLFGLLHGLVVLLAAWILAPLLDGWRPWLRRAYWAILTLIFCDVCFTQHWNSLYTDATALCLLFLVAAVAARCARDGQANPILVAGLVIAATFLATSKSQHTLVAVPVLIAVGLQPPFFRMKRVLALLAVAFLVVVVFLKTVPVIYGGTAFYNVVFWELLPASPNKVETLEYFGLPMGLQVYSRTHYYQDESGMRNESVRKLVESKASHLHLLQYYMAHPGQAWKMMMKGLTESSAQRIEGFGNLPKSSNAPPSTPSRFFSIWSETKRIVFLGSGAVVFGYLILTAVLGILGALRLSPAIRWRALWFFLAGVVAAGISLGVSTLADVLDLLRHLQIYTALVDVLFAAALGMWIATNQERLDAWWNLLTQKLESRRS